MPVQGGDIIYVCNVTVTKVSTSGVHCVLICVPVCVRVNLPTRDRSDILLTLISELEVSELVNIFGIGDISDSLSLKKNIQIHSLPAKSVHEATQSECVV